VRPIALFALAGAAAVSAVSPTGLRLFRSDGSSPTLTPHRGYSGVPRAIALGILIVGLAGVAVMQVAPAVAGAPGPDSNPGVVATVRTIVLALAVVIMGLLARGDRVREAGWLIYPLLVASGLKVLLEDFRQSEAATLFVALVVYGTALIVGPRLASR